MEQTGISIISPPNITDSPVNKSKPTTITLPAGTKFSNVKEKYNVDWFKSLLKDDNSLKVTLLAALAEMIGTAILVFLGCMGCVGGLSSQPNILQISLAFGFAVMVAAQSLGHISGAHINPAITVGSVVMGVKSLPAAVVYIVSQCIGGLIGFGLLKGLTPEPYLYSGNTFETSTFCVTDLHPNLNAFQGFLCEVIATGLLMFVVCSFWDARNEKNTDSNPIKVGLTVTVLVITFGAYTGASLNPARSLAPAIYNNQWSHHWIYWFGPMGGGLLSSILYRAIFHSSSASSES